jgi:hypothetical protein
MNKLLYKPLGMLFSVLGGLAASALFKRLWRTATGEDEAPEATDKEFGWTEVLIAATVQGAIFGLVKAAIDRGGATGYRRLTGRWPDD